MKNNPANNDCHNVCPELISPLLEDTQSTDSDSILAVSPQKTQACTGNKFAMVGGAL